MRPVLFLAVVLLSAPFAAPSRAEYRQKESFAYWKGQDVCARQAHKQFPDYTPESNAKREQAFRTCLSNTGHTANPALDGAPAAGTGETDGRSRK